MIAVTNNKQTVYNTVREIETVELIVRDSLTEIKRRKNGTFYRMYEHMINLKGDYVRFTITGKPNELRKMKRDSKIKVSLEIVSKVQKSETSLVAWGTLVHPSVDVSAKILISEQTTSFEKEILEKADADGFEIPQGGYLTILTYK